MAITERTADAENAVVSSQYQVPASPGLADDTRGLLTAVAILSAFVGGIHLAVTQEHLEHWWVYGVFFLVLGLFQVAFAAVVFWRPTWPVALAGITVNVGVVLIYVASRTVGLPLAPEPEETSRSFHVQPSGGDVEAVGPLDLAATAGELVLVALLVTLLPLRMRRIMMNVLLTVGILLWVVRFSGVLG